MSNPFELEQQEARSSSLEGGREQAVVALREHSLAAVVADQAARWRQNRLLGDYIAAMEQRVDSLEGDEQTAGWVEWTKGSPSAVESARPASGAPSRP